MGSFLFNLAIAAITTNAMLKEPSAFYYVLFGINCFAAGGGLTIWIMRRAA